MIWAERSWNARNIRPRKINTTGVDTAEKHEHELYVTCILITRKVVDRVNEGVVDSGYIRIEKRSRCKCNQ
jgi:hypothetical protein